MESRALLLLLLGASACQRNHGYPWPTIEGAQTLLLLALEDGSDGRPDAVRSAQLFAADDPPPAFGFFDHAVSRFVVYGYACTPDRFGISVGPLMVADMRERTSPMPRPARVAELDPSTDAPSWTAVADPPKQLLAALDGLPDQEGDDCARLSVSIGPFLPDTPLIGAGSVMPRYLLPAGDGTVVLGTLGGAGFRIPEHGEPTPFRFPGMERTILSAAPRGAGGFWLFDAQGTLWRGPLLGPFEQVATIATSTSPGRLAALAASEVGEAEEVFIMSSDRVLRRWDGSQLEDIASGSPHDFEADLGFGRSITVPFIPAVVRTGPSRAVTFGLGLFDEAVEIYDHGTLEESRIPEGGALISIGVHPTLGIFGSTIGAVYQRLNNRWSRLSNGGETLFMFLLRPEGTGMLVSGFAGGAGRLSNYARESGLCGASLGPALVIGTALDATRRVFVSMQVMPPRYDITKGTANVVRYDITRPFASCTSAD